MHKYKVGIMDKTFLIEAKSHAAAILKVVKSGRVKELGVLVSALKVGEPETEERFFDTISLMKRKGTGIRIVRD